MSEDMLNDSLIERLKLYSTKTAENIDNIRSVAARLHSRTASQDKTIREKTVERIWRKNTGILSLIVNLLETLRDNLTACSLAGILHECVSPRSGKNRSIAIAQLVAMNGSQIMVKLLLQMQLKETHIPDMLLQELMWVLSQLAQKDSKFSLKTRLLGGVKTFHYLLRAHHGNTKLIFPLLLVIKSLSRNSSTTSVLVKDGFITTLEKTIIAIGYSPSAKLRLSLNVLRYLSKSKVASSRIVKTSLISILLKILEKWERYEGKMRLRICNYTLVTLQNVCSCKLGRKSIRTNNGLQLLYKFCIMCPEDKSYDQILTRVCNVINMCLEKKQLPVETCSSPAVFILPCDSSGDGLKARCSSSSRETSPASDEDSGDDDPDDEDEEEEGVNQEEKKETFAENGQYIPSLHPVQRDPEDLKQYGINFQEIGCYDFRSRSQGKLGLQYKNNSFDSILSEERESKTPNRECNYNNHKGSCQNLCNDMESIFTKRDMSTFCSFPENKKNLIHGRNYSFSDLYAERKLVRSQSSLTSQKDVNSRTNSDTSVIRSDSSIYKNLTILNDIPKYSSFPYAFSMIASRVHSVLPFVKVAYPDLMGGNGIGRLEPLNVKDRKVCRLKMLTCVERGLHPSQMMNKVVYDLDSLVAAQQQSRSQNNSEKLLYNMDERHIGCSDSGKRHLSFESRFESGNLRKAIQIGTREYDLILMPDVNASKHHQWFYFEVTGMETNATYTFNIINCEKQNSQFNYGMKPIMYSVCDAINGRPGWVRVGSDVCYYRNSYQNPGGRGRCYLTTTFSVKFPHENDVCYFAYHFPYTYTQLITRIWKWSESVKPSSIYFRAETLCLSLNNNEAPLLTITAPDSDANPVAMRDIVFLTARVHPGESNASWIMHGTLKYLLSDAPAAGKLRSKYVFKIVPMLNMEGVINGCHRCGLTDEDLNRRWSQPNMNLHPVIYHTKGLIEYCTRVLKKTPYLFCDYHGHSRRKNVFLYGCSNTDSWSDSDRAIPDNPLEYLVLPNLMKIISPAFSLPLCSFRVERSRESTARVTVWREFGIKRSYTMESSYCGCDQGPYVGHHLDTLHLEEIGANFCEALSTLQEKTLWQAEILANQDTLCCNEYIGMDAVEGDDTDTLGSSDSSDMEDNCFCSGD